MEESLSLPILYAKLYFVGGKEVIKVLSRTQSLNLVCGLKYTWRFIIQFYM